MGGKAAPRLQDSTIQWPVEPRRLPKDAPNILIVLLDDVGFGISETFGGEVHTPTLSRLAAEGIKYKEFQPLHRSERGISVVHRLNAFLASMAAEMKEHAATYATFPAKNIGLGK